MEMGPVRLVLLGGFLGAGKTTAISRLASIYQERGLRVGIITNDQAADLVDTMNLQCQGFDVGEVTGACFCCQFDELARSASDLGGEETPEVILAEPVGSCTDLVATVIRPTVKFLGGSYDLAPYGVLLKPEFGRLLIEGDRKAVSANSAYIFRKQLEEADYIVINKSDELTSVDLAGLTSLARDMNPTAPVFPVSARTGLGFQRLVEILDGQKPADRSFIEVDYDRYARGEAELGWLNSRILISGQRPFSLGNVVARIAAILGSSLEERCVEIAHLKIGGRSGPDFAIANLVDRRKVSELSMDSQGMVREAELTINARVAIDPEALEGEMNRAVVEACKVEGLDVEFVVIRSFRPGRPVPIHRFVLPEESFATV